MVGGDGAAYPVDDWPNSRTFRLDRQDNLLIADNHTRAFDGMSDAAKAAHTLMTWGEYASDLPDVPRLGFRFDRGSLAPAPARRGGFRGIGIRQLLHNKQPGLLCRPIR